VIADQHQLTSQAVGMQWRLQPTRPCSYITTLAPHTAYAGVKHGGSAILQQSLFGLSLTQQVPVLVVSCLMCNMMLMLACLHVLSAYLLTTLHIHVVVSCPCKGMFAAPKPTPSPFNQVSPSLLCLLVQIECRLCLTVHNNEGNYLAHTQVRQSLVLTEGTPFQDTSSNFYAGRAMELMGLDCACHAVCTTTTCFLPDGLVCAESGSCLAGS